MFQNVTPEKAFNFIRIVISMNCSWPLPSNATRTQMLRFQIQKFVAALNASVIMVSLIYSVHVNWNDKIILTKVVCFADPVMHIFVQMFFSTIHYDRIQALVEQVQEYCANAKPYEKRILQRYLDKYSMPYGVTASWFYLTPICFFIGTMFIEQPFPIDAAYPFPVDYEPLRSAIFLHHGFVCMQCTSIVCNNVFAALLIFFAAARFEMVMEEFRAVESMETLIQTLQKYYRVKSFAQEVVSVMQYTAITTTILATLPLVLCGLNIISRQPAMVKVQFAFMAGIAILEVFMVAWPADNLLEASENAVQSLFESPWYNNLLKLQKAVLFSLVPQKPVFISCFYIIPVLSLRYFCSYVSNALSIFTALRLVVNDDNES